MRRWLPTYITAIWGRSQRFPLACQWTPGTSKLRPRLTLWGGPFTLTITVRGDYP